MKSSKGKGQKSGKKIIEPKVYSVDPMNFRNLVQSLTGAPETSGHSRNGQPLQAVAPPAIGLPGASPMLYDQGAYVPQSTSYSAPMYDENRYQYPQYYDQSGQNMGTGYASQASNSSMSNCDYSSYPLASPGTLSELERILNIRY